VDRLAARNARRVHRTDEELLADTGPPGDDED
jgi:hypothetical protein